MLLGEGLSGGEASVKSEHIDNGLLPNDQWDLRTHELGGTTLRSLQGSACAQDRALLPLRFRLTTV